MSHLHPLLASALESDFSRFFAEDDLSRNLHYTHSLPSDLVNGVLYFKSDMTIAGLPFFISAFRYLGASIESTVMDQFYELEGKKVLAADKITLSLQLPFSHALTGERIALNLLQHASSIATCTASFVDIAKKYGIAILDTRKTTPGLRSIEKYAVVLGGGKNHRLGQADLWMVKDNHKNFFGGLEAAVQFFRDQHGFYTPIEVEIHDLSELKVAMDLGVRHLMLDNFSPSQVRQATAIKLPGVTYEISGGVRLETLESYCLPGVDAISVGAITYDAPHVDISFKYGR